MAANPAHYGNHIAEVVHWDIPEVNADKHPQVLVELKIVSDGPAKGAQKFWYGSLHPNAIEITTNALVAMGFKGNLWDLVQDPNATTPNTGLEKGRQLEIQVKPHEYQGKTYERVNIGSRPSAASMPIQTAKARLGAYNVQAQQFLVKAGVESDVPGF